MKIAIVYDRVNKFGGAERVLLTLHEMFPRAPLYTSVYSPENAKWAKVFPRVETSFLNKIKFFRNKHEFLAPLMPFAFSNFNFDEYDLVISVTSEFAKNINVEGKHICYCLTPTRYLWNGYNQYFKNKYIKILTKPLISYLRKVDVNASKKPDEIIAISTEVQSRIKKYYKRDAKIIFPPASNISNFGNSFLRSRQTSWPVTSFPGNSHKLKNNYYLVVSRLVKYKKVDLVIEAFNELKLPLVIVGSGREESKLKKKARKNMSKARATSLVKFLGQVSDEKLAVIYKNALGLIFPQEEDFGIVAVEAQSYGIPVIAYEKGGARDIVTKKTGIFFDKQDKKSLINAIKSFQKRKFDKKILQKNAQRFSEKRFKVEFLKLVKSL